jgi:hypothetical protein
MNSNCNLLKAQFISGVFLQLHHQLCYFNYKLLNYFIDVIIGNHEFYFILEFEHLF